MSPDRVAEHAISHENRDLVCDYAITPHRGPQDGFASHGDHLNRPDACQAAPTTKARVPTSPGRLLEAATPTPGLKSSRERIIRSQAPAFVLLPSHGR